MVSYIVPISYISVLAEIKDRADWLDAMRELGQDKKYRSIIQNQIGEKLREVKRLEKLIHETTTSNDLAHKLDQLDV